MRAPPLAGHLALSRLVLINPVLPGVKLHPRHSLLILPSRAPVVVVVQASCHLVTRPTHLPRAYRLVTRHKHLPRPYRLVTRPTHLPQHPQGAPRVTSRSSTSSPRRRRQSNTRMLTQSLAHSSPQVAVGGLDRVLSHRVSSVESLERSSDSDSLQSYPSRTEPPPLEKLLRTSHEPGVRRTSRENLRHSSDSLLSGSSGTPERALVGARVTTTHLPPGMSATITLSPQSHATTSPLLPPSGSQSRWTSDSHVYKMDSPVGGGQRRNTTSSHSAKDITDSPTEARHNGRVLPDRTDSYGLTVSLHMDTHKPNYADSDYKVTNVARRSDRNSVPDRPHQINMVSERLRKFESADSVDRSSPVWSQRDHRGYDGVHVLSRAADYENKYDDDDRSRRKRMSHGSAFSTPTGSTMSLPQSGPPPEIHKVPATPPATINFYFRESPHGGSVNLEPSPERVLVAPAEQEAFRIRVSSEPPDVGAIRTRRREQSPVTNISIRYPDQIVSPLSLRRPAARQASYLAAVSPKEGRSIINTR